METAVFGMGCFWCYQPIFQNIKGVLDTKVGYAGGNTTNPTYEEVSTGDSGHAEVVLVDFDPSIVSYSELLNIFWNMHDPTTLNRQGNDVGTQYRSVILTTNPVQSDLANQSLQTQQKLFKNKIVTLINPLDHFYEAEEYHQFFYQKNPNYGYCSVIINPKLSKFREKFNNMLKDY